MSSTTSRTDPRLNLTCWESPVLPLAAVLLALLGLLALDRRPTTVVVLASAGYLLLSVAIWLIAGRSEWPWLAYPAGFADVAYVTLLLALFPGTALPLWLLYLIPLAAAGGAGRAPALAVGGLSLGGYLAITALPAHTVSPLSLWPLAVLAAGVAFAAAGAPSWTPERREWRFWPEVLAAARGLGAARTLDEAAEAIVERARRLTRCDAAWLCWCDETGGLRTGAVSGAAADFALPVDMPAEWLLEELQRGPVDLSDVVPQKGKASGEAMALQYEGGMALLGVVADQHRLRRPARIARLRAFAPWAAEALTQAQERDWQRAHLAREEALAVAARAWATTENPVRAQEAALRAVQEGLAGNTAMLERPSGRVLLGDATLAADLDEQARAWLSAAPDPGRRHFASSRPAGLELVAVRAGLALAVACAGAPFDETELEWLDALASGLSGSLERCAAHAAVEADVERLRAAVEATPAPIAIWDSAGRIMLANSAYSSLDLGAALPVEPPPAEPQEVEVTAATPPRTFMLRILPVMEGAYLLAHYREVTREREALRAKDELIAMVGHELRSPLTSIRGYSQMMSRQLRIVQAQVTQLDALLSGFVEAAQRETGELQLSRTRLDFAAVVRDVAERFRGAHEDRPLRVQVEEGLIVDGDPTRLAQVLDNLLGNAVKYSPADSPVEMTAARRDGRIVLGVRDEGIGIDPQHLPSLFDRFYRVPASEGTVNGLGLGLSIVRDIVVAHGGSVRAESPGEGLGSTFWVTLPEVDDAGTAAIEETSTAG